MVRTVRLLLDTHVALWWLADDPALAAAHRTAIGDSGSSVLFSSATVAEISIRASLGRLEAPADLVEQLTAQGFEELPLTAAHAARLRDLPRLHRDPSDRMLLTQAREAGADPRHGRPALPRRRRPGAAGRRLPPRAPVEHPARP